jgi:hypothetical protein
VKGAGRLEAEKEDAIVYNSMSYENH